MRSPRMTLRLRLVLALAALVVVGLAVFGVATYTLYSRAELQRLDDQLTASIPLVRGSLYDKAGMQGDDGPHDTSGDGSPAQGRPKPPTVVPPSTYAELRDASGTELSSIQLVDSTDQPDLAADLTPPATGTAMFTTGSTSGSGEWRVAVASSGTGDGNTVIVAIPLNEVTNSLRRLVYIEAGSATVLLALLAVGSWLILRRGLRPLEQMATTARTITAGDLSQRVAPSERPHGGRPARPRPQHHARRDRGGLPGARGHRAAPAPVPVRRLPRAAHAAHVDPGLRRAVPARRRPDRVDLAVILRRIEEESARMKTLVDDLLLLARLDETRPVQRAPVDLAVLAADACSDAIAVDPSRRVVLDAPGAVVVVR